MEVLRMAVNTCYWPLFEVEDGEWRITYKPRQKPPVEEWLKMQGRFRHLFQPKNRHLIDEIQRRVDEEWNLLLERAGET
jgi:pyruvate ferredoxin oxidoreductase beta subunit